MEPAESRQVVGPVWVIVVAAGTGARFGGAKQFEQLSGRRVVDWAIAASRVVADGVVVVVPADHVGDPIPAEGPSGPLSGKPGPSGPLSGKPGPSGPLSGEPGPSAPVVVVPGAASRSGSVRAGLAVVPADAAIVVVHDAARPFAAPALFEAVVAAVRAGADGAVPGVALSDTVKRVQEGRVIATLDRAGLVAVQTPQAFTARALRRAHAGGGEATDDAGLVESTGGRVMVVDGDRANTKITHRRDLGPSGPLSGTLGPSGALSGDLGPSGALSGDLGPSGRLSGDLQ